MKNRTSKRRKPASKQAQNRQQKLARNAPPVEVLIDHIGGRGDGVGTASFTHQHDKKDWSFFVPHTLPGERVRVQPRTLSAQGIHADLLELLDPSPDRIEPVCPVALSCGGCQFQHMHEDRYVQLKEDSIRIPLERANITVGSWRPMARSPLASRRRVRFGLRRTADQLIIGLHERASERLIEPQGCITIDPRLLAIRKIFATELLPLLPIGTVGELYVAYLDDGVDALLIFKQSLASEILVSLSHFASECEGLVRLVVRSEGQPDIPLYVPEPPRLSWPGCAITPSPGGFLQPTASGEAALQAGIAEIALAANAKKIIDLFCGSGTLSLPLLAKGAKVQGADTAGPALEAFQSAADKAGYGGQLTLMARNLYEAPLGAHELKSADLVILDPPRIGARDQIDTLAASGCALIAYVSCNPHRFAKDAAILLSAGYQLDWCQPVDQFLYTSHAELIAQFSLS